MTVGAPFGAAALVATTAAVAAAAAATAALSLARTRQGGRPWRGRQHEKGACGTSEVKGAGSKAGREGPKRRPLKPGSSWERLVRGLAVRTNYCAALFTPQQSRHKTTA